MKTKLLKLTMLAIVVLTFATSCVPAGGGNPSPTNSFNVGLIKSSKLSLAFYGDTIVKSIIVDGDEIKFKQLGENNFFGSAYFYLLASVTFPNNNYEVLTGDTTYLSLPAHYFYGRSLWNLNTTVNNNQLPSMGTFTSVGNNIPFQFGAFRTEWGFNPWSTDYSGFYEYLIFRKPKNGSYQYYWVKVLGQENWNLLTLKLESFTLKIENGRYQMDGIVAGQ